MTILALELSASRLLGAGFGTSQIVWAVVIGLTLLYLTIGYFIGGRLADRYPTLEHYYTFLSWSAFLSGLIVVFTRPVMAFTVSLVGTASLAVLWGALIALILLYTVPLTLMAISAPYATRLAVDSTDTAGQTAGRIYAISTVGSIVGSFLPVLILIPALGTRMTIWSVSMFFLIISLVGLGIVKPKRALIQGWMLVVLLGLLLVI